MENFIFIGYDERQGDPFHVAKHSFLSRSSNPRTFVHKIDHRHERNRGVFSRPWLIKEDGSYEDVRDGRPFSVQFSHSRFLTPYLAKEKGASDWAMFIDCDVLCLDDVDVLFDTVRRYHSDKAVVVVKHDYKPTNTTKMDGMSQFSYNKKCWSAMMLFNLNHPEVQALTPEIVDKATGRWLHQFDWLSSDDLIGAVDESWQFIPDHSEMTLNTVGEVGVLTPSIIHYTEGGPWFEEYRDCTYGDLWFKEFYLYKKGIGA
jgi:lipopolysaccharide biosynthesis glycosyltransferase